MSIVNAAYQIYRVAGECGALGRVKVVLHFDTVASRQLFEEAVLAELKGVSRTADKHFDTVKDLRIYDIPFEFVTPEIVGGDE